VATTSDYAAPDGRVIRAPDVARREGEAACAALGAELFEGGRPTFEVEFGEALHRPLLTAIERFRPTVVLTHWPGDAHHDHRAVGLATIHCCRRIPRVLLYRSNWDPAYERFDPRFFVDIAETLEAKVEVVKLHASEFARTEGRWEEAMRARARDTGAQAGCDHAEGFQVLRWLA